MLTLLLAAALVAPPSVAVDGFVGRRFDPAGRLVGYVLSRRADVYSVPVVLPLVTTDDGQEDVLRRGGAVRVVGRRGPGDALVVESVAASREFSEFP
jgi:hypothetical protein